MFIQLARTMLALLLVTSTAHAELSANLGFQSQYIFRGVPQADSSAQGGLDFESNGFYAGTWAADVGMGAEVDLYAGYAWTVAEDLTLGIGGTGYFYTDDFDDTYSEVNLNLGYKWLSIEYSFGQYDNFDGPTRDYDFTAATFEWQGAHLTLGSFGADFDGEYYELGYTREVSGVELSLSYVFTSEALGGGMDESNLVFGIGKTFGLVD